MTQSIRRYSTVNGGEEKPNKTVADVNIDNTYSTVGLIGSSNNNYASTFFQNTLWKMENFSGTTPPARAIEGQIWFNTTNNQIYVYIGDDGLDSTQLTNWRPFVKDISDGLAAHIALTGSRDPHEVTKSQVGLDLVDNVPVFDKTLNFADALDKASIRNNLSIYSSSETYTQSIADGLFLGINSKAVNADKLDGYDSTDLVTITAPRMLATLNANSITANQVIRANNDKASIAVNTSRGDFELLSGFKSSDLRVITGGESGSLITFGNRNADPTVKLQVYNTAAANTVPVLAKEYVFAKDNLYIGGSQVYHKTRIPTNADVGSLPSNGKAVNAAALNGFAANAGIVANSIVASDGAGDIWARYFRTTLGNEIPNSDAQVIFRNDQNSDNYMRLGTLGAFQSWLNIGARPNLTKAYIAFEGGSLGVYNNNLCTVYKLATGRYRIPMNAFSTPAIQLVLPIVSCLSSGNLQTGFAEGTGRLDVWGAAIWIRSTSIVDIDIMRTYNINAGYWAREQFQTVYADNYYISFAWFF